MGGEWKEIKLSDLCDSIDYGYTASAAKDPVGPKFLRITDIVSGYIDWNSVPFCEIDEKNLNKYMLADGDIVIARTGANTGSSMYVQNPSEAIFASYLVRLSISRSISSRFVSYYLKSPKFWSYIRGVLGDKSAQPNASASTMTQVKLLLPTEDEQQSIAHILGSLDDKIELNRKMNETLEAMAQALFKSWFVDFDPVIDKALAAGNPIPKELSEKAERRKQLGDKRKPLPKDIASLFPGEFEKSKLGWIPQGWEINTLYDLFELIGGGTPKTSNEKYWGGTIPWFSVVDAPSLSDVFVIDTAKNITEIGVEKSSTKMLPVGTTIISARGTVGKCAVVGVPMAMNQSCYGVYGKDGITDGFVYYTIREQVADLQQSGHGSVFNTITRDTFKSISVPFSSHQLLSAFDECIIPYFSKIRSNLFESKTLSSLRDTLLPKLISGELRVSENFDYSNRDIGKSIIATPTVKSEQILYTVGHSNHTIEEFLDLIKLHNISAIADVRSSPYSKYASQFNKENFEKVLLENGIKYVFLGKELGGRPTDPRSYTDGKVDYNKISRNKEFKKGIDRLLKGIDKYRLALMCSEGEPLDCHRTVLICQNIRQQRLNIKHILPNSSLEKHSETERKLLKIHWKKPDVFEPVLSEKEILQRAYKAQAAKIAYKPKNGERIGD